MVFAGAAFSRTAEDWVRAVISPRSDLLEIAMADPRYAVEAYEFLFQALPYTQQILGRSARPAKPPAGDADAPVHHVTGQELCRGIRQYALDQFGLMAPVVFRCWGIHSTTDFGKMVYHLIESGLWQRSETDSLSDFEDQFDFGSAFGAGDVDWSQES
jgi:uncharacterized repeat protein (TIGR04138 family)